MNNSSKFHARWLNTRKGIIATIVILSFSLFLQACSSGTELAENDQAPEFKLPSSTGTQVALSDVNANKPVLLYFHMALG